MNKRFLSILAGVTLIGMLGACENSKAANGNFVKEQYEGKSEHWNVVMKMEDDSHKSYAISYIGKGKLPDAFHYKITDSANKYDYSSPHEGEGELDKQEEFTISVDCGDACDSRPKNKKIPVVIQWEGQSEKVQAILKD